MSLALFWVTLRLSKWAIVGWAALMSLYSLFVVYVYPYTAQVEGLAEYLRSLPEALLRSIGLDSSAVEHLLGEAGLNFNGWLVTQYFGIWPIFVGIYAFIFGAGIVAKEADRGTIELLLSHPVQRYTIVATKFATFLVVLAIILASSLGGILLGTLFVDADGDLGPLILVLVQAGMAVVAIAAYSTLVSCLVLDPRKALAIAGGIVAASYILNFILPMLEAISWVGKLSLFYYYQPYDVLVKGTLPASGFIVYGGVTIVSVVLALVVFQRRKAVL